MFIGRFICKFYVCRNLCAINPRGETLACTGADERRKSHLRQALFTLFVVPEAVKQCYILTFHLQLWPEIPVWLFLNLAWWVILMQQVTKSRRLEKGKRKGQ